MDEREEWYLEVQDAAEEAKRDREETRNNYSLCDQDLLDYSLQGVESFRIYK